MCSKHACLPWLELIPVSALTHLRIARAACSPSFQSTANAMALQHLIVLSIVLDRSATWIWMTRWRLLLPEAQQTLILRVSCMNRTSMVIPLSVATWLN